MTHESVALTFEVFLLLLFFFFFLVDKNLYFFIQVFPSIENKNERN